MFRERENNLTESGSIAEVACRQAIAKAGFTFAHTPASFHWSQLVNPRGDKLCALKAYENLLQQEPENKSALEGLAYLYQIMGQHELAQEYRRKFYLVQVRQYGVDECAITDVVDYMLAKTGEAQMPDRVPSAFLQTHFDQYAPLFDEHLVDYLEYCAPELIANYLHNSRDTLATDKVLDLGCGTGLMGVQLSHKVSSIDGVDISTKMLDQARQRSIYNQLIEADFVDDTFKLNNIYSLVIAADVFNYHGNLLPVFNKVKSLLASNGRFIFTVEKSDYKDIALRNTGRYQHSTNYINQLVGQCGFDVIHEQDIVQRKEEELPVNGLLYCLTN